LGRHGHQISANVVLECSGGSATQLSTLIVPDVAIYKTEIKTANQKQCLYQHKGSWNNNRCEVYSQVREICVKVSLLNGAWDLNTTWGGFGCHSRNEWEPVTYEYVRGSMVSFGHGLAPRGELDLASMQVRVRSGLDPWIAAEQLTEDTLDFGSTQKEEVVSGIICEVLGALLMMPLVYRYWEDKQTKKDRRSQQMAAMVVLGDEDEEEFSNPLTAEATSVAMSSYDDVPASTFGGARGHGLARPVGKRVGL